jgi:glycosyltransferase involved in cell wall biosynthesis
MSKKAILVFSDWYFPGFKAGGPIRSLMNIVDNVDCDFFIVTRITDYHTDEPYQGIAENIWTPTTTNTNVMYVKESMMTFAFVESLIGERKYHKFYLNSLFSPLFTILPLRVLKKHKKNSRTIVAPRGMLKSGALSVKSKKKKLFLLVAKLTGLYGGVTWHATSKVEGEEIRAVFKSGHVHVAEVLASVPKNIVSKPNKHSGMAKFVSFTRISEEKGVLEAITFLSKLPTEYSFGFDIYGAMPEGDYLEKCKSALIDSPNRGIRLMGEVNPNELATIYSNYHFFLLPTWGENFGHAISEALCHSTPVIISNKTPWKGLEKEKAGWDLPLKEAEFVLKLTLAAQMGQDDYSLWSTGARAFGLKHAENAHVLAANRDLFE